MKPQLTFWDIPIKGRVHSEVEPETFCSLLLMPWCHLGEWSKGGWQFWLPCLGNPEGSPWVMKQTFTHCSWRKHWGHLTWKHTWQTEVCSALHREVQVVFQPWSTRRNQFPRSVCNSPVCPPHRMTSDGISGLCGGHTVMRAAGWLIGRSIP